MINYHKCGSTLSEFFTRNHQWLYQPLQWRHNGLDSVSNPQPHDCVLKRLFRHRSKKTSKLRVTGLCAGNSLETGELPAQHKGLVTRKMFPFDDVIMFSLCQCWTNFQDDSTNYYLIINSLTHSGQMASSKLVSIDSGNGLVPHSNKTINLTNIDLSSVTSYGIPLRTISKEMLKISVLDMRLKITNLRSQLFFSQGPMSLKIDQYEQHLYALICVWCGLEYIRG